MKKKKFLFLIFLLLVIFTSNSFSQVESCEYSFGGIIRTDIRKKNINLIFTAHDFGDGGEVILNTLKKQGVKASFFFTGDFYRNKKFTNIIKKLKKAGHYLGAHSDKHLLYIPWENRDSLLINQKEFQDDLLNNYKEMKKFGVDKEDAPYFIPPYEWYNKKICEWCEKLGIKLINFTPGTSSNADYTTPDMGKRYLSSDTIYNRILNYEKKDPNGLNGFILLIHFGTDPRRPDKLYNKLNDLIIEMKKRGYKFTLLKESIE